MLLRAEMQRVDDFAGRRVGLRDECEQLGGEPGPGPVIAYCTTKAQAEHEAKGAGWHGRNGAVLEVRALRIDGEVWLLKRDTPIDLDYAQAKRDADLREKTLASIDDEQRRVLGLLAPNEQGQSRLTALGDASWEYGEDNDGWYVGPPGEQICYACSESNAVRIVACVNACMGITTGVLNNAGVTPNNNTKPGRPEEMQGGKRRNVYLDDASWAKAVEIGNGNASDGIRLALARGV